MNDRIKSKNAHIYIYICTHMCKHYIYTDDTCEYKLLNIITKKILTNICKGTLTMRLLSKPYSRNEKRQANRHHCSKCGNIPRKWGDEI